MFEAWQLICFVVLRLKFQFTTYATREQSNLSSIRSHLEGYRSKYYPLKKVINNKNKRKNAIENRIRKMRILCLKLHKLFVLSYILKLQITNLLKSREVKLVIIPISLENVPFKELSAKESHKQNKYPIIVCQHW